MTYSPEKQAIASTKHHPFDFGKWPRKQWAIWTLASLTWMFVGTAGIGLSEYLRTQNLSNTSSAWTGCAEAGGRFFPELFASIIYLSTLFILLRLSIQKNYSVSIQNRDPLYKSLWPVLAAWALGASSTSLLVAVHARIYCPVLSPAPISAITIDVASRFMAVTFVIVPLIYSSRVEQYLREAFAKNLKESEKFISQVDRDQANLFDLVHGDIQSSLLSIELLAAEELSLGTAPEFSLRVGRIANDLRNGPVNKASNLIGNHRLFGSIQSTISTINESFSPLEQTEILFTQEFKDLEDVGDPNSISPETRTLVARVVQELLINGSKHGKPGSKKLVISTTVRNKKRFILLQMSNKYSGNEIAPGRGISTMTARLEIAGGEFNFKTVVDTYEATAMIPLLLNA